VTAFVAKQAIELALLFHQGAAERLGAGFHRSEQRLGAAALLRGEAERRGQFQDVRRAGETIEFRRLREPHALPRQVELNLLGRKSLDVARLLAGVRRSRLGRRSASAARRKSDQAGQEELALHGDRPSRYLFK
jgi:hypothetical protein